MTDLSSDLAAIRVRCLQAPALPDLMAYAGDAIIDRAHLLARLEEMRGALNRVRDYFHALDYGGKKEADMIVDDIRKRVSISLRPLDVPG